MKKNIVLFAAIICLLLAGCTNTSTPSLQSTTTSLETTLTTETEKSTTDATQSVTTGTTQYIDEYGYIDENGIFVAHGKYYEMDWDNMSDILYEDDMIPNQEAAIAVATAFFKSMHDGDWAGSYDVCGVFYDDFDEVWIVTFAKGLYTLGDAHHIMMDKATGEVLHAWYSVN